MFCFYLVFLCKQKQKQNPLVGFFFRHALTKIIAFLNFFLIYLYYYFFSGSYCIKGRLFSFLNTFVPVTHIVIFISFDDGIDVTRHGYSPFFEAGTKK